METRPRLRDGVDVFLTPEPGAVFAFLASRTRIEVRCKAYLQDVLPLLDGSRDLSQVAATVLAHHPTGSRTEILSFVRYLLDQAIALPHDWEDSLPFEPEYAARIERQLEFLLDMTADREAALDVQKRIARSTVGIIGLGAVGSWACRLLAMMGFRHFILVDPGSISAGDAVRGCLSDANWLNEPKPRAAQQLILEIEPNAVIDTHECAIQPGADLEELLLGADMLVSAADEPYVGYVNILLSRYCIAQDIPLLALGGFDAHLGCLGELIVPKVTPCADCYSSYFTQALQGWSPAEHPVSIGDVTASGGLGTLSAMAAGAGILKLLRYLVDPKDAAGGRQEFHFDDYRVESFSIERDRSCRACGAGAG